MAGDVFDLGDCAEHIEHKHIAFARELQRKKAARAAEPGPTMRGAEAARERVVQGEAERARARGLAVGFSRKRIARRRDGVRESRKRGTL